MRALCCDGQHITFTVTVVHDDGTFVPTCLHPSPSLVPPFCCKALHESINHFRTPFRFICNLRPRALHHYGIIKLVGGATAAAVR